MTASLSILGEVRFSLDGDVSATTGSLRGEGDRVIVYADDPAGLIAGSVGADPGWLVPFLADQLNEGGLTVDLTGPRGVVASLGAGIDSTVGRIVGGTRRLRVVDPVALVPLARARVRPALPAAAVGALALAGLAVLLRVRRR